MLTRFPGAAYVLGAEGSGGRQLDVSSMKNPPSSRPANRYDQRRSARVRVHFPARYASSNLQLEGHVTDLSADGLFFCSDFLDDQGEMARVWVELPSRPRPVALRGEVRWVNDRPHAGGMGLRLVDVSLEDRALLASLEQRSAGALGRGLAAGPGEREGAAGVAASALDDGGSTPAGNA